MSLVNQMLRDLDARQAPRSERLYLADLAAPAAPAAPRGPGRRAWPWGLAALALALGLGAAWLERGRPDDAPPAAAPAAFVPAPASEAASVVPEPTPEPVAADPVILGPRLLQVLPGNDGGQLSLLLVLDRPVGYLRSDAPDAVRLQLHGVHYAGPPLAGGIEGRGQRLAWQVEPAEQGVTLRLTGDLAAYAVQDRLESAGDQWQLWVQAAPAAPEAGDFALPAARADEPEPLPAWMTAPAPVEAAVAPAVRPAAPAVERKSAAAPSLRITARDSDPLDAARRALADGREVEAIVQLQALHQAQPDDARVILWLARAYLAAGDTARLQAWLPPLIAPGAAGAELRLVLARAQLAGGSPQAAIGTLRESPPAVAADPAYHALLAALYQQVGDWRASADTYRRLLAVRADGAWHLGLAIALDQLGERRAAAEQFGLALRSPGLEEGTRRYARERLGALGES